MDEKFEATFEKIRQLEQELEREFKEKNRQILLYYQEQKIKLERNIQRQQAKYRTHLLKYVSRAGLGSFLVAPIIYAMIIPIAFFDLTTTFYQQVCFRVYRIPLVKRKDYFYIDRHHLGYLNILEKFNCVYCGYGNGVAAYTKESLPVQNNFGVP